MASARFEIKTHVFRGQHIRHYPGATRRGDSDALYLEAKQYIPLDNPNPHDGDVTIIGTHATSFPKELYEPLWEDLLAFSERNRFRIRAIWTVDASNQGGSGVLNEGVQGDDPSTSDYARDILQMTNVFRDQMVQPIVGVGHSIGGTGLVELSCLHPRLMTSLILFDPIIGRDALDMGITLIYMASTKPDLFPSRHIAEKAFGKVFRRWDPRTLKLWTKYGLRDTPTLLYPEPGKVTLRTPSAQEAWSYARPRFDGQEEIGVTKSRIKYPDATPEMQTFYRPEAMETYDSLPRVRPDVLWVFPEHTGMSKEALDEKVARTGTAVGGSGGAKDGKVACAVMRKTSHLCTFEDPGQCARVAAEWLRKDLQAWRDRAEYERRNRDDKSIGEIKLSKEWIRQATEWHAATKPPGGTPKL